MPLLLVGYDYVTVNVPVPGRAVAEVSISDRHSMCSLCVALKRANLAEPVHVRKTGFRHLKVFRLDRSPRTIIRWHMVLLCGHSRGNDTYIPARLCCLIIRDSVQVVQSTINGGHHVMHLLFKQTKFGMSPCYHVAMSG